MHASIIGSRDEGVTNLRLPINRPVLVCVPYSAWALRQFSRLRSLFQSVKTFLSFSADFYLTLKGFMNLLNHSSNTWGAFHLGKISCWKFRKHPGSNGKALFARVNQKSNKMDVVALPGTLLQFRRRKWNFVQKLNNFDFAAIAAVCCFFARRDINRVQNYLESTDADAILNDTIRNENKTCDCPWTTLTGKHWKWREKFQAPAAGRRPKHNCANGQKFLFQPVGTEKLEYLGRSPVCSEKISDRTARFSIFNQTGLTGSFV